MDNIEAGIVFDGRIIYEADDYDIAKNVYDLLNGLKKVKTTKQK
jgi:hypothetical protein